VKPLNESTELFSTKMLRKIAISGGVSESYSCKRSRLKYTKNDFDYLDDIEIEEN